MKNIIEYAELEGTHHDHRVLTLPRMPQEFHRVCGSIIQTLLELSL